MSHLDIPRNIISLLRYPKYYFKKFTFFSPSIRMSGRSVSFGEKYIKKSNFYKNKEAFKIFDKDVNKTLVPKKKPYGTNKFKYFIG